MSKKLSSSPNGACAADPLPANTCAVQAQHISLMLGSARILNDISFTIPAGQTTAIMGSNGSGKSTLMRTLLGIYQPTHGSINIRGRSGKALSFDDIGYVPQKVTPQSGIPATALEVVRSGLLSRAHLWADHGKQARKRALSALELVGLKHRAHEHVHIFSGGQQQRVAIARALVRNPKILMLDEPLAGIDAQSRSSLAHILGTLKEHGVTQLIVLHEQEELAPLLDRVIYIHDGRIVYDGTPHGLPEALNQRHDSHHAPPLSRHHAPALTSIH